MLVCKKGCESKYPTYALFVVVLKSSNFAFSKNGVHLKLIANIGLIIFILSCASNISGQSAQKLYTPEFHFTERDSTSKLQNPVTKKSDSLNLLLKTSEFINKLRANAFLEASLDKIEFKDSIASVHIHQGPQYKIAQIKIPPNQKELLDKAGFRTANLLNKPLDLSEFSELFESVLDQLGNNGYPFSSVGFSNYSIEEAQFSGEIEIEKGPYILMDTFNLFGLNLINPKFLYNYLEITPGDPYDASKILKVKNRINNLPFLKLSEDPTITFLPGKAMLNIKLETINASRFDFIIGVLPNSNAARPYTISGDINFQIQNKFQQGEQLAIKFERLKPETQKMDIQFQYPYLLGLPFGIDSEFNFFRNENQNRDVNFSFGVLYQLGANRFLKAFWNRNTSRLIEINTLSLLSTRKLPSSLDIAVNNFGIQSQWQELDYRFNPRSGYQVVMRGTAGTKTIIPNNNIISLSNEQVNFQTAYDTLDLSTYQFKADVDLQYFFPLFKRSTILTKVAGSKIFSKQSVFRNEYSRIGGNQILRGFDEESIWAEFYVVGTLEYRLLLTRNSFVSTFFDYSIRQNKYETGFEWDNPYGLGAGFSLETGAGIFGISVAVGSQKGNALDFRNTKTHMGFISLF